MENVFWRMLTTAGVVSAFLAVLLPARRWLTDRYAPQVRWGLWQGMAALLILGIFVSGFAALPATSWHLPNYSVTVPVMGAAPAQPEGGSAMEPSVSEPAKKTDAEGGPAANAVGEQAAVPRPQASAAVTVSAASAAAAVWLAGAAGTLLWQGIRYSRTRRRLLASSVSTDAYAALVREMGANAAVRVVPGLESPMAMGVLCPVVLLPEGEVPDLAVRHELTHILRHDLGGKGLLFLACALYWFDPLVWTMARIAGEDMEAACDAQLVRDMTAAEKRAYGELLLAVAGGRAAPLSTRFGASGAQMKSRLTQLFHPGKSSWALTGMLLAVAFAVTGLSACRGGEDNSSLPPQRTEGKDGSVAVSLMEGTVFTPPESEPIWAVPTGRSPRRTSPAHWQMRFCPTARRCCFISPSPGTSTAPISPPARSG